MHLELEGPSSKSAFQQAGHNPFQETTFKIRLAADGGLCGYAQVDSPARASLEALWARAGQAGLLRLEVETVRVAEQERALEEARHHLQQWDCLVRTLAFLCTVCFLVSSL